MIAVSVLPSTRLLEGALLVLERSTVDVYEA